MQNIISRFTVESKNITESRFGFSSLEKGIFHFSIWFLTSLRVEMWGGNLESFFILLGEIYKFLVIYKT